MAQRPLFFYDWNHRCIHINDPEMASFLDDIYDKGRYLAGASDKDLEVRTAGLLSALVEFDLGGAALLQGNGNRAGISFLNVLRECVIRGTQIERYIKERIEQYRSLVSAAAIRRFNDINRPYVGSPCLLKFIEERHVDSVINGRIRFKLASTYKDSSLPMAIADDELSIPYCIPGLAFTTREGKTTPVIDGRITATAAGDYYISCFSTTFRCHFFRDFGYDSCVLITNAEKFRSAVQHAFIRAYPTFTIISDNVEYVDTFQRITRQKPIELRKSINYEFEKELRFAAWPNTASSALAEVLWFDIDPRDLEYCAFRSDGTVIRRTR